MEMDRLKQANELAGEIYDLEEQLKLLNSRDMTIGTLTHILNDYRLLKLDNLKQELKEALTAKLAALKEEFETL